MIGIPALLILGAISGILTNREWGIGMLVWLLLPVLAGGIWKVSAKKNASDARPEPELSEAQRKLMLRNIRKWKLWVGLLVVCLPIGIANGVEQRAWLPTLAGVGVSLSLMFAAIVEIRRLQRRLVSAQRCGATLQGRGAS